MSIKDTVKERLWAAQRQFRHNNSNEFVIGFDYDKVIDIVTKMMEENILSPKGAYFGLMSGCRVEFKAGSSTYEAHFTEGVRGINVPVNVYVTEEGRVTCHILSSCATKVFRH